MNSSRRNFIQKITLAGLSSVGLPQLIQASNTVKNFVAFNKKNGLTILFQGDSITDGNRTRNNDWNHVMGHGYQYIISSKFWFNYPEKNFMFYNRGISGNRVSDLEARWQKDALDLKPDIISILVGINDVGAIVRNQNPEPIEKFETHYRNILSTTKKALPNCQIVLCEPFILPLGRILPNIETYTKEVTKQQKVIRQLAKDYAAIFIELQEPFNKACEKAPPSYWIWDGIHPMPAGHELIAREWTKQLEKFLI